LWPVYVACAGPVGLAAAASARILGAAVVMIGDMNKERLTHEKKFGFEPIDLINTIVWVSLSRTS
jgi:glutathione-independent formaldehyde dehydrogenase